MPQISGEPHAHNNPPRAQVARRGPIVRRRFPKADSEAAFDFYDLGRAKLSRMRYLTAAELRQSLLLALEAHETGVALHVLSSHTHLCGPKRRRNRRPLVKKY